MTAGNNGSAEDDDPFAYLYRQEGGEGDASGAAQGAPTARQGVPRTSYNQVTRVGERQYGGQQQGGYGYPQQHQQPAAPYGRPQTPQVPPAAHSPHAPQAQPQHHGGHGGRPGHGGGGDRGPNSKGLLAGAVAVVAAVAIGIGVAVASGTEDSADKAAPTATAPAPTGSSEPAATPGEKKDDAKTEPVAASATDLLLAGGAVTDTTIPGAESEGGAYVTNLGAAGASATWSVKAPKAGKYTIFVRYGVPGKDAQSTLTVNGKGQSLNMQNFARAKEGDWEKGWTQTYGWVVLDKGSNQISVSCEPGDRCGFNLDRMWLEEGHVS